ncbi:1936_t:CDS:1 [Funneliformis geosporum]|nr:1936_t:CDS:1 [Funneliformis geosporum]
MKQWIFALGTTTAIMVIYFRMPAPKVTRVLPGRSTKKLRISVRYLLQEAFLLKTGELWIFASGIGGLIPEARSTLDICFRTFLKLGTILQESIPRKISSPIVVTFTATNS